MGASDGCLNAGMLTSCAEALKAAFAGQWLPENPASCLEIIVQSGFDLLPLPGAGQTLERWRALAAVAAQDLSLAKLYEGHTDALAIMAELGSPLVFGSDRVLAEAKALAGKPAIWGVWASEVPGARVEICPTSQADDGRVLLNGEKQWCSGANTGSHALLTAWQPDGQSPQLVRLHLHQPGVEVSADAWRAVGMSESASLRVRLNNAVAYPVGSPGQYLSRPGFWQGGAGIAACWYGGATAVAGALHRATLKGNVTVNPFRAAAAGRVDVLLRASSLMLRDTACWIDSHPDEDASGMALQTRLFVAHCALQVLEETGAALGAAPYCHDAAFAKAAADLPVFIRQSHGDRDYAQLAGKLQARGDRPWEL